MSLKLNIGSGDYKLDGYTPVDRKIGKEAFPLDYPDESADEIRASHVLEHFSHRNVSDVLRDWFRVLKPNGTLKVAVPNFEWIARNYLDGKDINFQGYTMGGHVDDNDRHGTIFDRELLTEALQDIGFTVTGDWIGDLHDCSGLPVSLNIQAIKNGQATTSRRTKVAAVMSVPRLGFMDNFFCCFQALAPLGIQIRKYQGAFWGQCLSRSIVESLKEEQPDYILTLDYDTVFCKEDVINLTKLMNDNQHIDALCALQSSRATGLPLMTMPASDGYEQGKVLRSEFEADLVKIDTGHFGLTLLRASLFDRLNKPWFHSTPNANGEWTDGRVDDDIYFWHRLKDNGGKVYQANRVTIGHLELMICWPDNNFQTIHQHSHDYQRDGKPKEGMGMRIQLLKDWAGRKAGAIMDVGGGVADIWIRRHIAQKYLEGEPDKMLRIKAKPKKRQSNQMVAK